jgi:hypothetical protein
MVSLISSSIRVLEAKVRKGEIRNTVLRQVKVLQKALRQLEQGRGIKQDEISEYAPKRPSKARKLKKQVGIITQGLRHLSEALENLQKYKDTTSR